MNIQQFNVNDRAALAHAKLAALTSAVVRPSFDYYRGRPELLVVAVGLRDNLKCSAVYGEQIVNLADIEGL